MFKVTHKSGNARVGILKTKSSEVETPCFMPVATKGTPKFVTVRDLEEMQTEALISNSFILYLKPGLKAVGDIHKFMNFNKTIFTDCGAFQMLRDSYFRGFSKRGIRMNDPFTGKQMTLKPEDAMNIQLELNCDVAMALDNVPHSDVSKEESEKSIELTNKWHQESLDYHTKKRKELNNNQLLFGICQGAIYPDLRAEHAKTLSEMKSTDGIGFDGLAIGGLCIGEDKNLMYECVKACTDNFRDDVPWYHMGVGSPEDIVKNVDLGVDFFDSAYPTRVGRHGWLFTWTGLIRLTNSDHKRADEPIDKDCDCFVCKNHTKKYLYHLLNTKEPAGQMYVSYHNLYFIQALIRKIKEAIKEDNWENFKKDFLNRYEDGNVKINSALK